MKASTLVNSQTGARIDTVEEVAMNTHPFEVDVRASPCSKAVIFYKLRITPLAKGRVFNR